MQKEREILDYIDVCYRESEDSRKKRKEKNKINVEAYNSCFPDDFLEGKSEDQSTQFIPKTFVAVERLSKFITKAITDAGNEFFTVETGKVDIDPEVARALISAYLNHIGPSGESFLEIIERCIKFGLLKGEMVAKVTGALSPTTLVMAEGSQEIEVFKPTISAIDPDFYFPDPTGRGLYEIQEIEQDWYTLKDLAKAGVYKKKEVDELGKGEKEYRKPIKLKEAYGTFLSKDGEPIKRNAIAVCADDRLLRFEDNPFWHGESPFVYKRITVPVTEESIPAILDGPVGLNFCMNELFNLMLDSAVRANIGVNAIHLGLLENPNDIIGGVKSGSTVRIRADAPIGARVVEHMPIGEINPLTLQMYGVLESLFVDSSVLTDIAIGRAPPKEATATEIVQLTQSQSVLLSGFILSVEAFISSILRKLWLILMQNLEFLKTDDIISAIGPIEAIKLIQMSPEERFQAFSGIGLTVKGISDLLRRSSDIQKYTQFMGTFLSSPTLAQAFLTRFDMYKYMFKLAKLYGIDISDVSMSPQDQQAVEMMASQYMLGGGGLAPQQQAKQSQAQQKQVGANNVIGAQQ
jgi:hypothetical protein